jgi:hypothetical protein
MDKYTAQAARIVFGVFDSSAAFAGTEFSTSRRSDGSSALQAVAVGMFPAWTSERAGKGSPFTYGDRTTGTVNFDNVQLLNATAAGLRVRTGFALDAAKTTLTIAAAVPRAVFSGLPSLAAGTISDYRKSSFDCNPLVV